MTAFMSLGGEVIRFFENRKLSPQHWLLVGLAAAFCILTALTVKIPDNSNIQVTSTVVSQSVYKTETYDELYKTQKSELNQKKDSSDSDSDLKQKKGSSDLDSDLKQHKGSSDLDSDLNKKSSDSYKNTFSDRISNEPHVSPIPQKYQIKLKHITQFNDMPTGCEIVSAKMVLDYYGKNLSYKDLMSKLSVSKMKSTKDGQVSADTPYRAFVGDPRQYSGYGCYPPVIIEMFDNFHFEDLYIEDTSDTTLDELSKEYLPRGIPVMVWATIGMRQSILTDTWYVADKDGKPTKAKYTWRANEHCLVLIGYDEKNFYFSDPLSYADVVQYEKNLAEKRYKEIGSYSLIIYEY